MLKRHLGWMASTILCWRAVQHVCWCVSRFNDGFRFMVEGRSWRAVWIGDDTDTTLELEGGTEGNRLRGGRHWSAAAVVILVSLRPGRRWVTSSPPCPRTAWSGRCPCAGQMGRKWRTPRPALLVACKDWSGWWARVKNSWCCRVGLAQLIRFLVVKLIHLDLNHKFDIVVAFTINYFFS
jgi:hypothetical protein